VLTVIASIIGALATIYAAGFQVTAQRKWRALGGKSALMKGLIWPWCVVRSMIWKKR